MLTKIFNFFKIFIFRKNKKFEDIISYQEASLQYMINLDSFNRKLDKQKIPKESVD